MISDFQHLISFFIYLTCFFSVIMISYIINNNFGDFMNLCDINPHIRYAEKILYSSNSGTVCVKDCRIFFVVSGEAKLHIDKQDYVLSENTFFYCCAGTIYSITSKKDTEMLVINFDLSQKRNDRILPYTIKKLADNACSDISNPDIIDDCTLLNSYIVKNNAASCYSPIKKIITEFSSRRIFFREKCSSILKDMLIDLYRKQPYAANHSYDVINDVIEFIRLNFSKKITNSELAQIAGYHEYHLNRLFINQTGTSMHKYILHMRLDEAKRLLLNTNLALSIIAEETGFGSSTHFAAYFKRSLKMSPSEYREKYKNKI